MKAYIGHFNKKDGSPRKMTFVRLNDIAKVNEGFIALKVVGDKPKQYQPGQELVWDLEVDNFRVFNWNKITSPVEEFDIDASNFR